MNSTLGSKAITKKFGNENDWPVTKALELASSILPPQLEDIDNHVNLQLFTTNKRGDLVVLNDNGGLNVVNIFAKKQKLIDLVCDPPLTKEDTKNISRISFNNAGDKILLQGDHFLSIVRLPVHQTSLEIKPEEFDPKRFMVKYEDGTVDAVSMRHLESSDTTNLSQIKLKLQETGRHDIKSISQEIFLAKIDRIGYYQEEDGSKVLHAEWHSLSNSHICVLSDINALAIYNTDVDIEDPEQFHSLEGNALKSVSPAQLKSFCFGSSKGWEKFTCYVVASNGSILSLCPIVPYDCKLRTSEISFLRRYVRSQIELCKLDRSAEFSKSQYHDQLAHLKAQEYWLNEMWRPFSRSKTSKKAPSSSSRFAAPNEDSDDEQQPSIVTYETVNMVSLRPYITGISHDTWPVAVQGPLRIEPESPVGNKEGEGGSSAWDIISVNYNHNKEVIHSHPVLARLFSSGHLELLVLDQAIAPLWQNKQTRSILRNSEESTGFLVECLGLGVDDSGGSAVLIQDPASPGSLFVSHSTGVHMNHLPWLSQLDTSFNLEEAKCNTRHIFALSPSMITKDNPGVIGVSIVQNVVFGHILLVRLSSGTFEAINISLNRVLAGLESLKSNNKIEIPPKIELLEKNSTIEFKYFEEVFSELQNSKNSQITRVSGSTKLQNVDEKTAEFIIEKAKHLTDNDMHYARSLDSAIKTRLELHKDLIKNQQENIKSLRKDVSSATTYHNTIDEKMKSMLEIHKNLQLRAAAIVQAVQENQPVISKAEKKYHEELLHIQTCLHRMKPKIAELNLKSTRYLRIHPIKKRMETPTEMTEEKQKMCLDVLHAEKTLLEDTKSIIDSVNNKLKKLQMK